MSHMFEGCSSLTNIEFLNINTSNVQDISYLFHSCEAIIQLNFLDFNTKEVIDMSHMLQDCIPLSYHICFDYVIIYKV